MAIGVLFFFCFLLKKHTRPKHLELADNISLSSSLLFRPLSLTLLECRSAVEILVNMA